MEKVTDFNAYGERALATSLTQTLDKANFTYPVFGICGEAGEIAEKVKKIIRDKNNVLTENDKLEISKELGDVLWYINRMAWSMDRTLEDIANLNLEKLESRQKRGVLSGNGDNR